MLYRNSLKLNVFFYFSVGLAEILSVGLSDQYNSFLKIDFSHLLQTDFSHNNLRVIIVKPRKFICHVQLKTTCEQWHFSKLCLQN